MRPPPPLWACAAAGGALGCVLRWAVTDLLPDGGGFPWTTFAVNLTGSALLAVLPALPLVRRSRAWAVALGPGLLGGWTTLSAYAEQGRALLDDGRAGLAAAYLLGTLGACWLAVAVVSTLVARPAAEEPAP